MSRRELTFAVFLAAAAASIVTGVARLSVPVGFITAGVLFAVWSWLILAETGGAGGDGDQ